MGSGTPVDCPARAACSVSGGYVDRGFNFLVFAGSGVPGTWDRAAVLFRAMGRWSGTAGRRAVTRCSAAASCSQVACSSAGNCAVAGNYQAKGLSRASAPLLGVERGGRCGGRCICSALIRNEAVASVVLITSRPTSPPPSIPSAEQDESSARHPRRGDRRAAGLRPAPGRVRPRWPGAGRAVAGRAVPGWRTPGPRTAVPAAADGVPSGRRTAGWRQGPGCPPSRGAGAARAPGARSAVALVAGAGRTAQAP